MKKLSFQFTQSMSFEQFPNLYISAIHHQLVYSTVPFISVIYDIVIGENVFFRIACCNISDTVPHCSMLEL